MLHAASMGGRLRLSRPELSGRSMPYPWISRVRVAAAKASAPSRSNEPWSEPSPSATSAAAAHASTAAARRAATQRNASKKPRRERVAAAGGVDSVNSERGHMHARRWHRLRLRRPRRGVTATHPTPCARASRSRPRIRLVAARQPEQLIVVWQQIIEVLEHRARSSRGSCAPVPRASSTSADVTTPCSRANDRISAACSAAHVLRRAPGGGATRLKSRSQGRRRSRRSRWRRRRGTPAVSRLVGSAARSPRSGSLRA